MKTLKLLSLTLSLCSCALCTTRGQQLEPKPQIERQELPPAPPGMGLHGRTANGTRLPLSGGTIREQGAGSGEQGAGTHAPFIIHPKTDTGRFAAICSGCGHAHVMTTLNVVTNGGSVTESWLQVTLRCPECKMVHSTQVSRPRVPAIRAIEVADAEETTERKSIWRGLTSAATAKKLRSPKAL